MTDDAADHIQHHRAHIADAPRRREVADEICDLVRRIGINPKSVVDIGCGYGYFLAAARDTWAPDRLLGLDGPWIERDHIHIRTEDFEERDLETDLAFSGSFDLAVSLEVAEHLSVERGRALVASLTRAAPMVLFSAAIPGQGGRGHVNERFTDYWAHEFAAHDYLSIDILHPMIWTNKRLFVWFRQNLILFVARSAMAKYPHFEKFVVEPGTLARVHPEYFSDRVGRIRKMRREIAELTKQRL